MFLCCSWQQLSLERAMVVLFIISQVLPSRVVAGDHVTYLENANAKR